MKEIITVSLGPVSNYTSTHFWNFQDEWIKQDAQRNPVLFYETKNSQQYVPRAIFVDFRPNFGNFLSCFSRQGLTDKKEQVQEIVQSQLWAGQLQVTEQDQIMKSSFQRELDTYDNYNYESSYMEEKKQTNTKMSQINEEDDDDDLDNEEQMKNNFKEMMSKYKAGGSSVFGSGGQGSDVMSQFFGGLNGHNQSEQIDTSTAKAAQIAQDQALENERRKQQEDKTAQEYYEEFKFEEQVNYFTDFMQSKMQPANQLILPNNPAINEDNFFFYNLGKQMYDQETHLLRDLTEESLRNQLEHSDLLQGFQFICDTNSGFGSMAQFMIQDYVKDEVPKAPILLYSIKNQNKYDEDENTVYKQQLEQLNHGLWLSELATNLTTAFVPLDEVTMTQQLNQRVFSGFQNQSKFHQSSIYSILIDNFLNEAYKKKQATKFEDLLNEVLYQYSPNILSAQLMFPYEMKNDAHVMQDMKKEKFDKKNLVNFFEAINTNKKGNQHLIPTRQSYFFKGTETLLMPGTLSLSHFRDQFDTFAYKNLQCSRGHNLYTIPQSNLLPIPFPRYFTKNVFDELGLMKQSHFEKDEFVGSAPSLTRLTYDGSYFGHVKKALDSIKYMKMSLKVQLNKDYMMEEEDIREAKERLENLAEGLQALNQCGNDSEDDDDDDDEERNASDDY
ncbi:UNKNOWN [Stylonychia lemnae]|uniref:Uncharacterized protein n=1 Tax=Stylonychia lemnae TaxID=5949 RepID=A0A078ALH0_STYLE|nr:UNKNOWN [Stylonychia lemnae]|eukprot:CDW82252.1 UNKNOWN [Stylonychia lemnae]